MSDANDIRTRPAAVETPRIGRAVIVIVAAALLACVWIAESSVRGTRTASAQGAAEGVAADLVPETDTAP